MGIPVYRYKLLERPKWIVWDSQQIENNLCLSVGTLVGWVFAQGETSWCQFFHLDVMLLFSSTKALQIEGRLQEQELSLTIIGIGPSLVHLDHHDLTHTAEVVHYTHDTKHQWTQWDMIVFVVGIIHWPNQTEKSIHM